LEGATDRIGDRTADLGRTAALVGLLVLAVLLAADLLVTYALLDRHAADLNQLGRLLGGAGDAGALKVALIAGVMAFVLRQRVTRLRLVCAVWALAGVYVTVVVVNAYTLRAAAGAG
jgi:hypothetical protein